MRLKPYPVYKDPGVPWLGKVPAHWEVVRLKKVCRFAYGDSLPTESRANGDIPVYGSNGRVGFHEKANTFSPCIVVGRKGSFGKLNYSSQPVFAIDTTFYVDHRFTQDNLRWLFYILSWARLDAFSRDSAVPGLDRNDAYQRLLPWCPPEDQTAIARFLDASNYHIRCYIRAKQRLIKLLEEQKQAIIHHAVTRGLDPNVRLKPSGIEWLGDVPEHWEVMPLRRVTVSRCDGPFGSGLKSLHYTDQGIRVVRLQNIGHAEFKGADVAFISPTHYATLGDHTVEPGDLLIAGLGDEHHPAGRACVAPSSIVPAMVKADCFRFRLFRRRLDPEFAALQLTATAVDAASFLSTGATRQRINLQAMASRSVAVPPIREQLAIVQHIRNETSPLRQAISNADCEIALLREYRTRLIADVVTGKLDVREVAAQLPDETEEPEPLDDADALSDVEEDAADNLDAAPEEDEL